MKDITQLRTDRMSWTHYEERLKEQPILFLPVGAHEQHGPHLPMGTDAIFATDMAEHVADRLNGLVLPTLAFGYKSQARSGGGQTFPGTLSLDGATLTRQITDILRELARHGANNIVIMDGHYENQWFITEGIELAMRELSPQDPALQVVRVEYWDYTPQETLDTVFEGDFPGVELEHAALIETSMMLHLHPEWVNHEQIPANDKAVFERFDHYPQDGTGVPASGVLAPAGQSSAEKGRLLVDTTVDALAAALQSHFSP